MRARRVARGRNSQLHLQKHEFIKKA